MKIDELGKQLLKEWGHSSRIMDMIRKPTFAEIVSFGPQILPFLFRRLHAGEGRHWEMMAIRGICKGGPAIPDKYAGRIRVMEKYHAEFLQELGYGT